MGATLPGSSPASTTGALPCTILPWFISIPPRLRLDRLSERFGAADDVQELLGDALLAGLVVLDREHADHLLGVLGGRFHRGHARTVLARHRLHQGPVHLGGHVAP